MAPTIEVIARYCSVSAAERALLSSAAAPIVLCDIDGRQRLPDAVAPGLRTLGFMLPIRRCTICCCRVRNADRAHER
jgi:hydrogenase maturation protein HypF